MFHMSGFTTEESVRASHDFIINVQKRKGSRAYTGEGGCRLCGAFLEFVG